MHLAGAGAFLGLGVVMGDVNVVGVEGRDALVAAFADVAGVIAVGVQHPWEEGPVAAFSFALHGGGELGVALAQVRRRQMKE